MHDLAREKRVLIGRVPGVENVADGGTKPLVGTSFLDFRLRLGITRMPPHLID